MPSPILVCSACHRRLQPIKTGQVCEERKQDDSPYRVYSSDALWCEGCKVTINVITSEPIAEHYQEGYSLWTEKVEVTFK